MISVFILPHTLIRLIWFKKKLKQNILPAQIQRYKFKKKCLKTQGFEAIFSLATSALIFLLFFHYFIPHQFQNPAHK